MLIINIYIFKIYIVCSFIAMSTNHCKFATNTTEKNPQLWTTKRIIRRTATNIIKWENQSARETVLLISISSSSQIFVCKILAWNNMLNHNPSKQTFSLTASQKVSIKCFFVVYQTLQHRRTIFSSSIKPVAPASEGPTGR